MKKTNGVKEECDCCGDKALSKDGLGAWQLCPGCAREMVICDCCGDSLNEVTNIIQDEHNNWACIDCYQEIKEG